MMFADPSPSSLRAEDQLSTQPGQPGDVRGALSPELDQGGDAPLGLLLQGGENDEGG